VIDKNGALRNLLAWLDTEGGISLADKLTAARAALLDQITALRLAELDPANLPADIDTLKLAAIVYSGLGFKAIVTSKVGCGANDFICSSLIGIGAGVFAGATAPYRCFVLRDDGGLSAAPQGEMQTVTAYDSATGKFTTAAFTASVEVGDTVIIIHPRLAEVATILALATTIEGRLTAARATNLDSCTYLEQTVPIVVNSLQTLTNAAADKDFTATNTKGGQGLISTDNAKLQKAFLVIIGRAVNSYAGTNALDCTTATHNQWKMNIDNGAYADLVNGAFADGQMLDNDWRCAVEGAIHPFTLMFDITTVLDDNVDGLLGVRLENGRSEQSSLIVTCDIYLKLVWKL